MFTEFYGICYDIFYTAFVLLKYLRFKITPTVINIITKIIGNAIAKAKRVIFFGSSVKG